MRGISLDIEKKYGVIAFPLAVIILVAFFLTMTTSLYSFASVTSLVSGSILNVIFLGLPGFMLFVIGFHLLFGKALPLFEGVCRMVLMIFGIYVALLGILLFVGNILAIVSEGANPAAAILTLISAGLVGVGNRIYDKGKEFKPNVERMEKKRDVRGLIKALRHKDVEVREPAAKALVMIGGVAVEPLVRALKDKNQLARRYASEVLGDLGDATAVESLNQALKDEDVDVRCCAAEALGKIGDVRAVGPLIQTLKDKENLVQLRAARALGKMGDVRVVEPLIELLRDEDKLVREAAAEALGMTADARALQPLIQALNDQDKHVRAAAAEALGKVGDARVVEPLIKLMDDKDWFVRRNAAKALGDIRDVRAVESLALALKDEYWEVRQPANEGLEKIRARKTP